MKIKDVIRIMQKHNDIINRYYTGEIGFDVSLCDGELDIRIHTRYRKLPSYKYANKIKRLFKAIKVDYVETCGEDPAFWNICIDKKCH